MPRTFSPNLATLIWFPVLEMVFVGAAVASVYVAATDSLEGLLFLPLWLAMATLGACLAPRLLAKTRVDDVGVRKSFWGWSEAGRWEEIVAVDVASTASKGYELQLKSGRRIWLPFDSIRQGYLLRRIIDENRPRMSLDASPTIIGKQSYAGVTIGLGGLLILIGIIAIFVKPDTGEIGGSAVGLIGLVILILGWMSRSSGVTVDQDGISIQSMAGHQRIEFGDLQTIRLFVYEPRGGPYEAMEMTAAGKSVTVMKNFGNYAAVRDAIVERAASARIIDDRPRLDR